MSQRWIIFMLWMKKIIKTVWTPQIERVDFWVTSGLNFQTELQRTGKMRKRMKCWIWARWAAFICVLSMTAIMVTLCEHQVIHMFTGLALSDSTARKIYNCLKLQATKSANKGPDDQQLKRGENFFFFLNFLFWLSLYTGSLCLRRWFWSRQMLPVCGSCKSSFLFSNSCKQ